ncbi:MAG: sensor histidine kinase, partial [Actinomycetes bacterium]
MNVLVELGRAAPLALLFALPVALVGGLVVHRMRRRSMTATLTALVLVPQVAALVGVLATSGFMYTPQLVGTVAVVAVVAAVTVPTSMLLGRSVARETLW